MFAFVDPETGRTYTWRQTLAVVRRRVTNRVPLVGRTQLGDALQHAIGDLAIALRSEERRASAIAGVGTPARYVDSATGLYLWGECLDFLRRRTLQRIARESRKAHHEQEALAIVDAVGECAPKGSLSTAAADPHDIVANRDLYNRVVSWFASLPEPDRREFALLLDGRSQVDLAAELGITQQAVAQRQEVLRRRLRDLAIAAGLSGGLDGFYDSE